jgi:hypothetical protein
MPGVRTEFAKTEQNFLGGVRKRTHAAKELTLFPTGELTKSKM